jgi:hypothetical protein
MNNYIETNCTVEHEGKVFECGGAEITDDYVIAYMQSKPVNAIREFVGLSYEVSDWHGTPIGRVYITGRWRIPRGPWGQMISGRLTLSDGTGRAYNVRGMGFGMVIKGKRAKA